MFDHLISEQRRDAEFGMSSKCGANAAGSQTQLPPCGSRLNRARNALVAHFSPVIDWKEVREACYFIAIFFQATALCPLIWG